MYCDTLHRPSNPTPRRRMPTPDPSLDQRYRIGQLIGEGGFGRVYAARDLVLERDVAVKIAREGHFPRFAREARAAAALQSLHAVRVFDFGLLETGAPYLVMERLNGHSLKQHLHDSGPVPAARAVQWVLQICHALSEAHTLGLVHRDVKPSNLFLHQGKDDQLYIKLLDFGLVTSRTATPEITESGVTVGSPAYMAPEQLRGGAVDARVDVWALGIVLFEMITGKRPFEGPTNAAILTAVAADPPQLEAWGSNAPMALLNIVERCLRKDPNARIQSVSALCNELIAIQAGNPICVHEDPTDTLKVESNVFSSSPPTSRSGGGPNKVTWKALALALSIGTLATLYATRSLQPPPAEVAAPSPAVPSGIQTYAAMLRPASHTDSPPAVQNPEHEPEPRTVQTLPSDTSQEATTRPGRTPLARQVARVLQPVSSRSTVNSMAVTAPVASREPPPVALPATSTARGDDSVASEVFSEPNF